MLPSCIAGNAVLGERSQQVSKNFNLFLGAEDRAKGVMILRFLTHNLQATKLFLTDHQPGMEV
jgi:hypothetical protein